MILFGGSEVWKTSSLTRLMLRFWDAIDDEWLRLAGYVS